MFLPLTAIIVSIVIVTIIAVIGIIGYQIYKSIQDFMNDMVSIIGDKLIGPLVDNIVDAAKKFAGMAEEIATKTIPALAEKMIDGINDEMLKILQLMDVREPVEALYSEMEWQLVNGLEKAFMESIGNMDIDGIVNSVMESALELLRDPFDDLSDLGKKFVVSSGFLDTVANTVADRVIDRIAAYVVNDVSAQLLHFYVYSKNANIHGMIRDAVLNAVQLYAVDLYKNSPQYALEQAKKIAILIFEKIKAGLRMVTAFDPNDAQALKEWAASHTRLVLRPHRQAYQYVKDNSTSLTQGLKSELGSWSNIRYKLQDQTGMNELMWLLDTNHVGQEYKDAKTWAQEYLVGTFGNYENYMAVGGWQENLKHYASRINYFEDPDKAWGWNYYWMSYLKGGNYRDVYFAPAALGKSAIAQELFWGLISGDVWCQDKIIDIIRDNRFYSWGSNGNVDAVMKLCGWCHVNSNATMWGWKVHERIIDRAMSLGNYNHLTEHMIYKIGTKAGGWFQTVGYGAHMVFNGMGDAIAELARIWIGGFKTIQSLNAQMAGDIREAWYETYRTFLPCGAGGRCRDPADAWILGDIVAGRDPFEKQNWLAYRMATTYGPTYASNISGTMINFVKNIFSPPSRGSGCFIAGTPVLMSDGSECAIEDIKAGDRVLSFGGRCCKQDDEQVTQELGNQLLYGFNEFEPFFTGGHCFQTTDGWKAIRPELTKNENVTIEAGKLQVGDIVFRRDAAGKYETIEIKEITSKELPADTKTYGLLLIGDNSYHANGFVVAMNYPIITAGYMRKGLKRLTSKERKRVLKHFGKISPELNKSISDGFLARISK